MLVHFRELISTMNASQSLRTPACTFMTVVLRAQMNLTLGSVASRLKYSESKWIRVMIWKKDLNLQLT